MIIESIINHPEAYLIWAFIAFGVWFVIFGGSNRNNDGGTA